MYADIPLLNIKKKKMKNILWVFGLSALLLMSCSDEFVNVNSTPNIPDPVDLVTSNISGTIVNTSGVALDSITVDLLVDGVIVGSTMSQNGAYSFSDQPAHESNTVVRAHSKHSVPSFKKVEVLNVDLIELNFVLDYFKNAIAFSDTEFDYNANDGSTIKFEDDYIADADRVILGFKTFSFPDTSEDLISIRDGIDKDGNATVVNLENVLYVGAYNFDDNSVILKADKNHVISLPANADQTLWSYQISDGKWHELTDFEITQNTVNFSTKEFTFFSYSLGGGNVCDDDTEAPTALCSDYTLDLNESYILYARDVDNGSYDNCTDSLLLSFSKDVDVCGNILGNVFCNDESGQEISCTLLVRDEAFNSSTCDFIVSVVGKIECPQDTIKPIPICINLSNVIIQNGDDTTVQANDFDAGSFDNCSAVLDFKVRKLNDACNNESDVFKDTVVFCAAEIDSDVTLRVLITDENGNSNSCDVSARVKK